MARVRGMHGREEECMQVSGGKAKSNETTMKTKYRWEDNIKIDLRERG
jgi:hypothetical protein